MAVVSRHCVRVDEKLHVLCVIEHQAQPLDLPNRVYNGVLNKSRFGAICGSVMELKKKKKKCTLKIDYILGYSKYIHLCTS